MKGFVDRVLIECLQTCQDKDYFNDMYCKEKGLKWDFDLIDDLERGSQNGKKKGSVNNADITWFGHNLISNLLFLGSRSFVYQICEER